MGEAVAVVAAVACAMAEAHAAGVVHRDLKPGNVMIDRRGRPVVMDFRLALRMTNADDLRVTLTGVALGTPAYMPPEQAGGDVDAIGPPADVYALGVILFELVTGGVPFRAKSFGKLLAQIERDPPPVPSGLNPDVPAALDALILTALSKSPADRFPTAADFADALDQFQAGRFDELTSRYGAAVTRTEESLLRTRPYPSPPRKRGRGLLVGLAAGSLAFLLMAAGAVFYVSTDHGDLKVELNGAEAKDLTVKVNGKEVLLDENGKVTTIRAGANQMLEVSGPGFKTQSQTFEVIRGKTAVATFTLVPKEPVAMRPEEKAEVKPGPKPDPKQVPDPKAPPPKPVEFPKAKTLIEMPGWQILADATRDDLEKWAAARKKGNHSVTWLAVTGIDGTPVYAAVAALDDRSPDWVILPDVAAVGGQQVVVRAIDTKRHRAASLGGFSDGNENRFASLWTTAVHGTQDIAPDDLEDDALSRIRRAAKSESSVRSFHPFAFGKKALRYTIVTDAGGPEKSSAVEWAMPAGELEEYAATLRKAEKQVIGAAPYLKDDALTYAVLTADNPDKRGWEVTANLTAAQLKAATDAQAKAGRRPATVYALGWDGAVRYSVLWVKDAGTKDPPK